MREGLEIIPAQALPEPKVSLAKLVCLEAQRAQVGFVGDQVVFDAKPICQIQPANSARERKEGGESSKQLILGQVLASGWRQQERKVPEMECVHSLGGNKTSMHGPQEREASTLKVDANSTLQ